MAKTNASNYDAVSGNRAIGKMRRVAAFKDYGAVTRVPEKLLNTSNPRPGGAIYPTGKTKAGAGTRTLPRNFSSTGGGASKGASGVGKGPGKATP